MTGVASARDATADAGGPWAAACARPGELRTGALAVAIEGANRPASLAVGRDGRVVSALLATDREHASDLMPELEALCATFDAHPRDLELVVVGLGPGSYTGLRVAAATGLGLALGAGAALVGVPSFEALALRLLAPREEGDVLVDAHGGYLYHARYRRVPSDPSRPLEPLLEVLAPPSAVTPDVARAALQSRHWIADRDALMAAGIDAPPSDVRLTSGARAEAATLLELGAHLERSGGARGELAVQPLYLRPFALRVRGR